MHYWLEMWISDRKYVFHILILQIHVSNLHNKNSFWNLFLAFLYFTLDFFELRNLSNLFLLYIYACSGFYYFQMRNTCLHYTKVDIKHNFLHVWYQVVGGWMIVCAYTYITFFTIEYTPIFLLFSPDIYLLLNFLFFQKQYYFSFYKILY